MKVMKKFLLFTITIFYFGLAKSQTEITLSVEPPQDTITIGDQVTLKISVEYPKGEEYFFPEFENELIPGIELVESHAVDSLKSKDKNNKHIEKRYVITSFDEGTYIFDKFPVLKIHLGVIDTLYSSNEITINVKTIELAEDFEPYDIKGIKAYPRNLWLWFAIVAAALLIIAFVIYKLKTRKTEIKPENKIPPFDLAVQKLDKLKESDLAFSNNKEYYSQLTDIVREYIELETNISVMEKTSDEILALLPKTIFSSSLLISPVKDMFFIADLVKFAKYQASILESDNNWKDAHTFVERGNIITKEIKQNQSENENSGNTTV